MSKKLMLMHDVDATLNNSMYDKYLIKPVNKK